MTSNLHRMLAGVVLLLGLLPAVAAAQQGTTVSGRVTNETSQPVQGVAISIPTLNVGGYTNEAGRYSFTVPAGRAAGQTVTLTARRIGYQPRTVEITLAGDAVTQDIVLAAQAAQLTGIVVTALGQTREKSTLGTAQQQVTSADLTQTRAQNVVDQIQGKVSGVQITGSGTQGGSTSMVIRGQNSITGSNQPLYVVDGMPISNRGRGSDPNGGYDYGSAVSDINPDDIETLTVLKGPNAAALYGSRAANGVVVITTKKGQATSGRIRTEFNSFYTWERPSILPEFQNNYGQGAIGEFDFADGAGGGVNDGLDQSWGPKLDGRSAGCVFRPTVADTTKTDHPFTLTPADYDPAAPCRQFNAIGGGPWQPSPDNLKDFFSTGRTLSSTLAVSGGTDRANARLSVGADNTDGIIPNSFFRKTSGMLTGALQINNQWSTNASLQYIRSSAQNRPGVGYNVGILEQFIWFGRQVDIGALRNYRLGGAANGGDPSREFNWNYNYHNNPWWRQFENPLTDARDRFVVQGSAVYRPVEWLTSTLRTSSDVYRLGIQQRWAPGELNYADPSYAGAFNFVDDYSNENNTELLVAANRNVTERVHLNATLGGNLRRDYFSSSSANTAGISVAGIYNVSNAAITPTLGQVVRRRQVNSAYGSAAFTWDGWFTVEGTARNDWSSTLPDGNNSYFYPSVNTSVVLTDAVPALRNRWLSYAKVRASLAQVGNDADPYRLATTFVGNSNKFSGLPQFSLNDTISNAQLKPEITRSAEAGVELSFLDGRATLDASYYAKSTRDQIFNIPISPTAGFQSKSINAGRIDNKGIEALLAVIPVQLANGFRWQSTLNFSRNRSKIIDLIPGTQTVVLGRTWSTNIEARVGEPYGAIFGYSFLRDSASGQLMTNGGVTMRGPLKVLGNIQPDWVGGVGNNFSFKNYSLNVLFDIRRGGQIFSVTNMWGDYAGVTENSLRGREVDWNNPGYVVQGLNRGSCATGSHTAANGTYVCVGGTANADTVTAETYFQSIYPVVEPFVYDASWVKLRELRLGYELPQRLAGRLHAQAVSLALTGRNLFTWTDVPNIDPEFSYTTGNFQGAEFAALPNARSIGISVRITP